MKLILFIIALGIGPWAFQLKAIEVSDQRYLKFTSFTVDEGMPQSHVKAFAQDTRGFLWLATSAGLSRYDGYNFKNYLASQGLNKITANINTLLNDDNNNLWVGTQSGRLYLYDSVNDKFINVDTGTFLGSINQIISLGSGELGIATDTGLYWYEFNAKSNQIKFINRQLFDYQSLQIKSVVYLDQYYWLIADRNRLFRLSKDKSSLMEFNEFTDREGNKQSFEYLKQLYTDPTGKLWISAREHGALFFDVVDQVWKQFPITINNRSEFTVTSIIRDRRGDIWIGTSQGLILTNEKVTQQRIFTDKFPRIGSISGNMIDHIFIDHSDNLWLSEPTALNKAYIGQKKFISLNGSMAYGVPDIGRFIGEIVEQGEKVIWFEHDSGLARWDLETDDLELYAPNSKLRNSISDFIVTDLILIEDRYLVIDNSRVDIFDTQTNTFTPLTERIDKQYASMLRPNNPLLYDTQNNLVVGSNSGFIFVFDSSFNLTELIDLSPIVGNNPLDRLELDAEGQIWVAVNNLGVLQLDKNYEVKRIIKVPPEIRDSFTLLDMYIDEYDRKWLGTHSNGLILLNQQETWEVFNRSTGFPDDRIYSIEGDKNGYIWIGTNRGLIQFSLSNNDYVIFNKKDGLVGSEFNSRGSHFGKSGRMYFGGTEGLTIFRPNLIKDSDFQPNLVFTSVNIFGATEQKPLAITDGRLPNLSYQDRVITFEFSALDFKASGSNKYRYRLNQEEWISLGTNNQLVFNRLSPNEYQLEVQGTNSDGVWSNNTAVLSFKVVGPIWLSWWAYGIYIGIILLIGWYIYNTQKNRYITQRILTINEKKVSQELRRLNRLKDQILANTSHEIRTPLNGIIGLNEALKDPTIAVDEKEAVQYRELISRSAKQLLNLIEDLIDTAQLKNKTLKLKWHKVDLLQLCEEVLTLLKPSVKTKAINLTTQIDSNAQFVLADSDRLRQVLFNLVSNGIKFTDKGSVVISARRKDNFVEIAVADTGQGIAKKDQQRIFSSFTQIDSSNTRTKGGAGLGLTISKEIIELHGSHLLVESNMAKGSRFFFQLEYPMD